MSRQSSTVGSRQSHRPLVADCRQLNHAILVISLSSVHGRRAWYALPLRGWSAHAGFRVSLGDVPCKHARLFFVWRFGGDFEFQPFTGGMEADSSDRISRRFHDIFGVRIRKPAIPRISAVDITCREPDRPKRAGNPRRYRRNGAYVWKSGVLVALQKLEIRIDRFGEIW